MRASDPNDDEPAYVDVGKWLRLAVVAVSTAGLVILVLLAAAETMNQEALLLGVPPTPPEALMGAPGADTTATPPAAPSQTGTPPGSERAEVIRVLRPNLIEVRLDSAAPEVREVILTGIDGPAESDPCYAEALRFAVALIEGKSVEMQPDVSDQDEQGRRLRWVFADGVLVNQLLVSAGVAVPVTTAPNQRYAEALARASLEAQTNAAGCYALGGFSGGN